MTIQWTGPLEKRCIEAYTSLGIREAMRVSGATISGVRNKMKSFGISSTFKKQNKFWAADIAAMFEMKANGLNSNLIAEYFNSSGGTIRKVMSLAAKNGFAAYPMRPTV